MPANMLPGLLCPAMLQLAALDHFRSQPASFLAAAALEGPEALRDACAKLPSPGMEAALPCCLRLRFTSLCTIIPYHIAGSMVVHF